MKRTRYSRICLWVRYRAELAVHRYVVLGVRWGRGSATGQLAVALASYLVADQSDLAMRSVAGDEARAPRQR